MSLTGCSEHTRQADNAPIYVSPDVEIVAHRGASGMAPENTLAAVKLAWEQDCGAVEVDVHLSQDKRIMAIHDPSTRRTGECDWKVSQTLASQLRELDVGQYKGPDFKGERIPFLSEVLETVPERGRLFIDIKCGPEIATYLHTELKQTNLKDRIVVIAFDLDVLTSCKQVMPSITAYLLRDRWLGCAYQTSLIKEVVKAGLDGIDVNWYGLTRKFVERAKQADLDLYVWTVDHGPVAQRMIDMGIQGITTNQPNLYRSGPC